MIKNVIVSTLIMSTIVAVVVWLGSLKENRNSQAAKSFVLAVVVAGSCFYFFGESGTDEVIENMLKGPPTF